MIPKKKKLLLVTDQYWPCVGGVEYWVNSVAALMADQYDVSVLCHSRQQLPGGLMARNLGIHRFTPYTDQHGVPVASLAPSWYLRILLLPLLIWHLPGIRRVDAKRMYDMLYCFYRLAFTGALRRACRGADLVHCFSTSYLARLVSDTCTRHGTPVVHAPSIHFGRWGDSPAQLGAYGAARVVIAQGEDQHRRLQQALSAAKCSIRIVPVPLAPGVPHTTTCAVPDRPFVLFLGRREPHKGADLLVNAFEHVTADVSLVMCGPGASAVSADSRVVDLGEVRDEQKEWLLSNCAVFCVPSTDETFGIVFVEAMQHGKPVIAVDVAPVNEIVLNGVTGILVTPGDAAALCGSLKVLLDDRAKREELGNNGLKRYRELFDRTHIKQKLTAVYEECAAIPGIGV